MSSGARIHAKYSGSIAHRILGCPGSVALCATFPPRLDSDAGKEGTLAHDYLEACLTGKPVPFVEPDMRDAVMTVLDYIDNLHITRAGTHLVVFVEQEAEFPNVSDAWCYTDVIVLDDSAREAWVIDFKYGMHPVDVENNAQLLFEAASLLWKWPVDKINLVIIQPRVDWHPKGVIREWQIDALSLVDFQAKFLGAVEASKAPDAPLIPGDWCRYCPAEVGCPAREQGALTVAFGAPAVARQLDTWEPPSPASLSLDRIAYIRRHKDALRSWLKAVDDYAESLAMQGVKVPGEKLVEAQARRRWAADDGATAAQLAQIAGGGTWFEEPKVIDVTKAEAKLVKMAREAAPPGQKDAAARKAREAMAFLTLKSTSGNLVLVPDSDPRPAADRASAAFSHVHITPPGV